MTLSLFLVYYTVGCCYMINFTFIYKMIISDKFLLKWLVVGTY